MSHDKSHAKLIYMANQIGKFFVTQGADKAAAGIAEHIRKFWDPRMRAAIIAHARTGGAGLDPAVARAVESLAMPVTRGANSSCQPHTSGASVLK